MMQQFGSDGAGPCIRDRASEWPTTWRILLHSVGTPSSRSQADIVARRREYICAAPLACEHQDQDVSFVYNIFVIPRTLVPDPRPGRHAPARPPWNLALLFLGRVQFDLPPGITKPPSYHLDQIHTGDVPRHTPTPPGSWLCSEMCSPSSPVIPPLHTRSHWTGTVLSQPDERTRVVSNTMHSRVEYAPPRRKLGSCRNCPRHQN